MNDDTELLALLDAVDEADSAASAQPWHAQAGDIGLYHRVNDEKGRWVACQLATLPNAELIALYRFAAPILATKVRELLAELEGEQQRSDTLMRTRNDIEAERDQLKEQLAEYEAKEAAYDKVVYETAEHVHDPIYMQAMMYDIALERDLYRDIVQDLATQHFVSPLVLRARKAIEEDS